MKHSIEDIQDKLVYASYLWEGNPILQLKSKIPSFFTFIVTLISKRTLITMNSYGNSVHTKTRQLSHSTVCSD